MVHFLIMKERLLLKQQWNKKTLMNVPLARGNNNSASRAEQVTAKEPSWTQITPKAAKKLRWRANSDRGVQVDAVTYPAWYVSWKYGLLRKMANSKILQAKKRQNFVTKQEGRGGVLTRSRSPGMGRVFCSCVSSPYMFTLFMVRPVSLRSVKQQRIELSEITGNQEKNHDNRF